MTDSPEWDVRCATITTGTDQSVTVMTEKNVSDANCELSDSAGGKCHGILVGQPITEIQCRVLTDCWGQPYGQLTLEELDEITLPTGQRGEIVVSGTHVLPNYLDDQANHQCRINVENVIWHRTGRVIF